MGVGSAEEISVEAAGAAVLSELEQTTVKAFLGGQRVSALLWTGFGKSLLLQHVHLRAGHIVSRLMSARSSIGKAFFR